MRYLTSALLIALLLLPLASQPVGADDEEKSEGLVTRLFDVSALMQGRPWFLRQMSVDLELSPDSISDEDNPLFGDEAEEPTYPLGQIDELIELIRMQVNPDSWESTLGAWIGTNGWRMLVVRSYPDIVDEVAAWLGRMERRHLRRVVVDVETYRLTAEQARGLLRPGSGMLVVPERFEALRGGDQAGPSVSLTAFERHRAAMFTGTQRAFLVDYDVEVAKDITVSDPIVLVAGTGLTTDVETILGPRGDSALLSVSAAVSRLHGVREAETAPERIVELPEVDLARVRTRVELPTGAWALLDGETVEGAGARWTFAVRVTALPPDGLADKARAVAFDSPQGRPARTFELQSYDIGMLELAVESGVGESINLVPSNFSPPKPPELAEPAPVFASESLIDLIRASIVPASWELKGASLDARYGYLYVRNTPDVLRAIGESLATLRREFIWSVASTGELVEVDAALGRRLESAPGRLLDSERAGLLQAALEDGSASRLGAVRVTTMNGSRNALSSGRRFNYLGEYEVELAEGAAISNPVIHSLLSGSVLDVEPVLTAGGTSVQTTVRFTRGVLTTPSMRKVVTTHGPIDMPEMDLFRVRVQLQAPLGKTLVVAGAGDGARRRLLLLTSRLRRAAK